MASAPPHEPYEILFCSCDCGIGTIRVDLSSRPPLSGLERFRSTSSLTTWFSRRLFSPPGYLRCPHDLEWSGRSNLERLTLKRKPSILRRLRTEQPNHTAVDLDRKSSLEIARLINAEDATVAAAVARTLPQIARAIDLVAAALRRGGRLIYVGAGTSGRIAALDAVECPPTFNTDPRSVQFIIAGGFEALASASEISEDDSRQGRDQMARRKPTKIDVVLGIASSGRTPFTVAAISDARRRGAHTIALTCNPNSPLERAAHFAIVTQVGPEILAGSSRMKAGTAHKMVLNMISTAAMTRLGYVYGNLMVNVAPKNEKLTQRAIGILERATGAGHESSRLALQASGRRTPVALVMLAAGVTRVQAVAALKKSAGHVRHAIALATTK
jgi:N-acetylmuramic acid 6-phosphate etherase